MVDKESLLELSTIIVDFITKNFETTYLSKNLVNTIKITSTQDNSITIEIPAEKYDISTFTKEGKIVYTNTGSYASLVDETGGFSGEHKNYIEKAIKQAIALWLNKQQMQGRIK